jgi:hypothetical protein
MSVTVCPMVRTVYYLLVTDARGCTARDSLVVCPVNISCGSGLVQICHLDATLGTTSTQCVSVSTVSTHLAHGDRLGACTLVPSCSFPAKNAVSGGTLSKSGEAQGGSADDVHTLRMHTYPNPTSGLLDVELGCQDCTEDATYELKVSDLAGRVLITTNVRIKNGEGSARLNLGDYSAGVYLVTVNDLVHRVMKL